MCTRSKHKGLSVFQKWIEINYCDALTGACGSTLDAICS